MSPLTAADLGAPLAAALAAATEDRLVYDLAGIERRHDTLRNELPGVHVRFAMKACPVDEVLAALAGRGAGADAASPGEVEQALRAGVPAGRVHYGNTVKSDRNIAEAHRLGVRTFATDSLQDVAALAVHAPGARVFCRVATGGAGALWGLSNKFGCPPGDAVRVLVAARDAGLVPAGLSVHVGSQQMTSEAWHGAVDDLGDVLRALGRHGIRVDHVNLGGGLPALGYRDRHGAPRVLVLRLAATRGRGGRVDLVLVATAVAVLELVPRLLGPLLALLLHALGLVLELVLHTHVGSLLW